MKEILEMLLNNPLPLAIIGAIVFMGCGLLSILIIGFSKWWMLV